MKITHLQEQAFLIESKDLGVTFGLNTTEGLKDDTFALYNQEAKTSLTKTFFLPGELEVGGVLIKSYTVEEQVVFRLSFEEMVVVHLGTVSAVPEKVVSALGESVDILFIDHQDTKKTKAILDKVQPRMVILGGDSLAGVTTELNAKPQQNPFLVLPKDLSVEDTDVVFLTEDADA